MFVFKLSAVCSHCSQTLLSHYLRETQAVHKVTKFSIKGKKDNFHFGRSFRLKTIFFARERLFMSAFKASLH